MGDGAADGKPMRLDAWRVSSRAPIGTLGSPDQFWATRTGGSSPCWLVIGCDGDIATRCVLLSGERVP
jgi:hypothetical protein